MHSNDDGQTKSLEFRMLKKIIYKHNNIAHYVNTAVIVTVAPVTLVLVESDYVGIPHVLWNLTFSPALAKYLM